MKESNVGRKGENNLSPDRSERIFTQHNYWYFKTREGMEIGPYDSKLDATKGIDSFIEFLDTAEKKVVAKISAYAGKVS
jgi:hypothetical protein